MHKTDDQQSCDAALIQSDKIKSACANHVRNQNDNGGKALRFTINDVLSGLRQKDVFDIEDVQYAVVETNGTLSVLLKPDKRPATPKTIGKTEKDTGMPCTVVIDGKIIESAFKDCGVTKDEVLRKVERETDNIANILLMTVDKNKKHNIIFKKDC